jgi:Flp pilus assembly protein TadG
MSRRVSDRGAVALFFAVIAPAWLAILGLVIVGQLRVREFQRADNIATEAARVAGSALDPVTAVPGGVKQIDPQRANTAVQAYFQMIRTQTGTDVTGTVTVDPGGQRVTVTTRLGFVNPTRVEYFGGGSWYATGQASATILIG